MRRGFCTAAVLAMLAAAGSGPAKTVEEVLKEKGVITEAEYKEIAGTRPLAYAPGKGFVLTSADGRFQLAVGGRIQARYTFLDRDSVNGTAQDVSEWRVRKMKLSMGGHAFTRDLTYRFQAAFENSGNARLLDEAYLDYRAADAARFQAGQFKVPFAREEITSDAALQFVDRANAADAFKPSYDIGAMLHGSVGKGTFAYHAGAFNGVGQSAVRTINGGAFAARAAWAPFGEMRYGEADLENTPRPLASFGANGFVNTLKKNGAAAFLDTSTSSPPYAGSGGWLGRNASLFDNSERVHVGMYGFDAALKWRGLFAQGEFFGGEANGQTTDRTVRARGYYAQAGYFILPGRFEVAGRYSAVDPNRRAGSDARIEVTGGTSYYFAGHNLKVQGDYTNIHSGQGAGLRATDDRQIRVQAQAAF